MKKINPMLDYTYLENFGKYEIVCTCSNIFYVNDLDELDNKSRCECCKNKETKISEDEINDLVLKFADSLEKRNVNV